MPDAANPVISARSIGAGRRGTTPPRGVLPFRAVRVLAFGVISLAIFACAFVGILAVWDFAAQDNAWRALATLGIIAAAMVAFVVVNEVFGASLGNGRPLQPDQRDDAP